MTTTMELQFEHSFPYLTERGGNLYHINADATSGLGALIRGNKAPLTMQFASFSLCPARPIPRDQIDRPVDGVTVLSSSDPGREL
ncbi:hypothetical protein FJT64_008033 [Amphibalanus amphitrite]|uniref:Uncharacterized protein n=1 Tax=Amphibalanus amphitrite TaxID=1232801 RepID=A0A6A4VIH5_AMPAM|nr:hypothetical protein FJT64_008033 [Amphibalanus amphitrite]